MADASTPPSPSAAAAAAEPAPDSDADLAMRWWTDRGEQVPEWALASIANPLPPDCNLGPIEDDGMRYCRDHHGGKIWFSFPSTWCDLEDADHG